MLWLEAILWGYFCLYPFYVVLNYQKDRCSLVKDPGKKVAFYQMTMVHLWLPTFTLLVLVFAQQIESDMLGFRWQWSWQNYVGMAAVLLLVVYCYVSIKQVMNDSTHQTSVLEQTENIAWMMPINKTERYYYVGVSISAGICEELLYRGYLIYLLNGFMSIYLAAMVSSVIFGLLHSYQGWQGVIKTAISGGVMAFVYLATDSILIPITLHIVVDIFSGWLFYTAHKATNNN